jgi:hypothetical protein
VLLVGGGRNKNKERGGGPTNGRSVLVVLVAGVEGSGDVALPVAVVAAGVDARLAGLEGHVVDVGGGRDDGGGSRGDDEEGGLQRVSGRLILCGRWYMYAEDLCMFFLGV